MSLPKPLSLSHRFLEDVVKEGDTVVDATLGNGHDALYLAQLVGKSGRLIGFDVQRQALDVSAERLGELLGRCELHCCGHEEIGERVTGPVAAVVFNLGYLPGADKELVTQTSTTSVAIEAALNLLRVGGVLSVMCYVGHEGGTEEGRAVRNLLRGLPRKQWRVFEYAAVNAPNDPPFLLVAERVR